MRRGACNLNAAPEIRGAACIRFGIYKGMIVTISMPQTNSYKFECVPVFGKTSPDAPQDGRLVKSCNVPRTGIKFNFHYPSPKYNIGEWSVNEWKKMMKRQPYIGATEACIASIETPDKGLTRFLEENLPHRCTESTHESWFVGESGKFYVSFRER